MAKNGRKNARVKYLGKTKYARPGEISAADFHCFFCFVLFCNIPGELFCKKNNIFYRPGELFLQC